MCWLFDWMMTVPVGDGWNLWEATVILVAILLLAVSFLIGLSMRKP